MKNMDQISLRNKGGEKMADYKYRYYPEKKSGAWFKDKDNFMSPTHTHSDGTRGFDIVEEGKKRHIRFP